eukprot:6194490-Pleurochrysis_carterae.AAC.2
MLKERRSRGHERHRERDHERVSLSLLSHRRAQPCRALCPALTRRLATRMERTVLLDHLCFRQTSARRAHPRLAYDSAPTVMLRSRCVAYERRGDVRAVVKTAIASRGSSQNTLLLILYRASVSQRMGRPPSHVGQLQSG